MRLLLSRGLDFTLQILEGLSSTYLGVEDLTLLHLICDDAVRFTDGITQQNKGTEITTFLNHFAFFTNKTSEVDIGGDAFRYSRNFLHNLSIIASTCLQCVIVHKLRDMRTQRIGKLTLGGKNRGILDICMSGELSDAAA